MNKAEGNSVDFSLKVSLRRIINFLFGLISNKSMKNLIKILSVIILLLFIVHPVKAEVISDDSAKILSTLPKISDSIRLAKKKLVMNRVLKQYESPMIESVDSFLTTCISYELNCYLLPSIAGLESTFGKYVLTGSNNPFGCGNGLIRFESWDQAINTVGKGLKENYINKGAESVEQIGPIYATSKTWANRVTHFINVFEKEEEKIDLILQQNQVN